MPNNATTERGKRAPKGVMPRLIRTVFSFYPVLLPVTGLGGGLASGCGVLQNNVGEGAEVCCAQEAAKGDGQ